MAKSSNYWDKRALKRLDDAEKMSEAYIKRIKTIYNKAFKDIDNEINNVYKNYSKDTGLDVQKLKELLTRSETKKTWEQMKKQGLDKYVKENYKARISRLEQIQAQIYAKAKQIYPKEELEQTMCYKGVINDSYYKAVYDTQMGTGYNFAFSKIDNNMLTAVLNERWSGKNYSQRIWGNTDILAESLSEVLGSALISGQSISKTSKQVRERFDISKYYAERLVRTETNHFNNMADAMAYEELGVEYYVFVATLDSRTSEICQSMDNKKFAYKDKEEGVNYPPLHPNCRSKTRGYVDEETEESLQRRARNLKTGKVETIPNMSYKEWAKKNGVTPKKKSTAKKQQKTTITMDNLPTTHKIGKESKNTQLLVDYINSRKNADPKVVKMYSLMSKMQNVSFKISHGKKYALTYSKGLYEPSDVKLTVPNIKDIDDIANINVTLHENMHLIDFMSSDFNNEYFSSLNSKSLVNAVMSTDSKISENVRKLFVDFNNSCITITKETKNKYIPLFNALKDKYNAHALNYNDYKKEWNKIRNNMTLEIDNLSRSSMGGGMDKFQDIYDALSRGQYREAKVVTYGHGKKYYSNFDNRVLEIVANYGTLSISRPDLIEILKKEKPALVKELDKLIETINKKYGG